MPSRHTEMDGAPRAGALDLYVRPDEQCIALTTDFRLLQPVSGHRYSVDDMLVAHVACSVSPRPSRVLDLGCGIGSVLLSIAWARPDAQLVGVEALAEHAALARRNVALNRCEDRARVVEGDLREDALVEPLGTFDLVTGTPPYFDPRTTTVSADRRRAHARWELRGGIEEYALAASRALAASGLFVACASVEDESRLPKALTAAGLVLLSYRHVVPRVGKPPFLALFVAARSSRDRVENEPSLVLRDEEGARTAEHVAIRRWFVDPEV